MTVNRYQDLIEALPRGEFYRADGAVLPFRDSPYEFELTTDLTDTLFQISFNGVVSSPVLSDAAGLVIIRSIPKLPSGEYEITATDPISTRVFRAYITIKDLATFAVAYADVFEQLDAAIDDMDAARTLSEVGPTYIQDAFGRAVHQPTPTTYFLETYRRLLQTLKPAYRHFGAHPWGVEQAVMSQTSVRPFVFPKHWRHRWALNEDLLGDNTLSKRSKMCSQQVAPAGAGGDSPKLDLTNINSVSRDWLHAGIEDTLVVVDVTLDVPQRVSATFTDSAQQVQIIGSDVNGLAVSTLIPESGTSDSAGTYAASQIFAHVASVQRIAGADPIPVGLADSRFVTINAVGDYNYLDMEIELVYVEESSDGVYEFTWGDGDQTACAAGENTLKDAPRRAIAAGTRQIDVDADYGLPSTTPLADALSQTNRLYIKIDANPPVTIDLAVTEINGDDAVTAIDAALNAALSTAGSYADRVVSSAAITPIECFEIGTLSDGAASKVVLLPGPADASVALLGLPRTSALTSDAVAADTVYCDSTQWMPDADFDIRIRGEVHIDSGACVSLTDTTATIDVTGWTHAASDVGMWIRWRDDLTSANDGMHQVIGFDVGTGFGVIRHETASLGGVFAGSPFTGTASVWHPGEVLTVTANDKAAAELTVSSAPSFVWSLYSIVEMVEDTPYQAVGTDGVGTLTITIDPDFMPADGQTDDVTIQGAYAPDQWRVDGHDYVTGTNISAWSAFDPIAGMFATSRLVIGGSTGDVTVTVPVPRLLQHLGRRISVAVYLQEHTVASDYELFFTTDGGTSVYPLVSDAIDAVTVLSSELATWKGPNSPTQIIGTFYVPWDTAVPELSIVRVRDVEAEDGFDSVFSIDALYVYDADAAALLLGEHSIVRSEKREKFGELLYAWTAGALLDEDEEYLGLPVDTAESIPTRPGHIDRITNAHGYWDRLDVTDSTDDAPPVRTNLRGMYDSFDMLAVEDADQAVLLQTTIAVPDRLSVMLPTRLSYVVDEELTMIYDGGDPVGSARADLSMTSDHAGAFPQLPNTDSGSGAVLLETLTVARTSVTENGTTVQLQIGDVVPVPDTEDENGDTPWEFTAADQIRINAAYYDASSAYTLSYNLLMRATTLPFETSASELSTAAFLWIADCSYYKRHNADTSNVSREEQLTFTADATATLSHRANLEEPATLYQNNGTRLITIDGGLWRFIDGGTVSIDASTFDTQAIYTLDYTALGLNIESTVNVVIEWRYGDDEEGVLAADWVEVEHEQVLSSVPPAIDEEAPSVSLNHVPAWQQLRVTVSGVRDVRDFALYGLGIKGINLFEDFLPAP